jgi:hypothetical protein
MYNKLTCMVCSGFNAFCCLGANREGMRVITFCQDWYSARYNKRETLKGIEHVRETGDGTELRELALE